MDRLSALDASLLALETPRTPLHTGGLSVFEPGLSFAAVHTALLGRLDRMPLARRRVQPVPLAAGRAVWVDDAHFDLSYHLRHAALPAPGDEAQLAEFVSRLISRPLDRTRPLWELYVIEGLEGDKVALLRKVHLLMGGGNMPDPFSALLDDDAVPGVAEGGAVTRWEPRQPPNLLQLAAESARDRLDQAVDVGRGVRGLARTPTRLAGAVTSAAGQAFGVVTRLARQAPPSPLNGMLTAHRRFVLARADLETLRTVRRAFGCTINDLVLTITGDAVGRLLRWRGHDTKDLDLRVMVPVRVHGPQPDGGLPSAQTIGEGVVGVLAPLPVMEIDPVARLFRVMGEMAGLKESRQAVAADALVRLAGYAPPNLHTMAARLASAEQRYNLALSNAPGPQAPRYLAGVRMAETYPFIPLAGDCALSLAVSSYAGTVYFGLLGDWNGMPDLDLLPEFLDGAVDDLVAAADASTS